MSDTTWRKISGGSRRDKLRQTARIAKDIRRRLMEAEGFTVRYEIGGDYEDVTPASIRPPSPPRMLIIISVNSNPVTGESGIDWERRYAELVETVAQRTDQAKGAK